MFEEDALLDMAFEDRVSGDDYHDTYGYDDYPGEDFDADPNPGNEVYVNGEERF